VLDVVAKSGGIQFALVFIPQSLAKLKAVDLIKLGYIFGLNYNPCGSAVVANNHLQS
jgi:hypothetical protein